MTTWSAADGQPSPNRLDAMVYGITYLMIKDHNFIFFG
jgi:phage terminase large subunit-like protein